MAIDNSHQFILASGSPRRREILRRLGFRLRVDPSRRPEPVRGHDENPIDYARRLAFLKAREVGLRYRQGYVIGADTIVVVRGSILGKPRSEEEARRMLRQLAGRWHEVVTAVCLLDAASRRSRSDWSRSRVHVRRLSPEEIDWYVATGEYRDKAGAYAIQGYGSLLVDRLEGCFFNVVGFPVVPFLKLCRRFGVDVIPAAPARRPRAASRRALKDGRTLVHE
jgi:nucleoside triphosphate pyrophosphatase